MEYVLELRSVRKQYATYPAVQDVSLALKRGEFFSLVGPSGCGKTTTLRMIAGLEELTAGSILLNGQPIETLPPCARNVSTVFQNYALFPHLTVEANVAFGLARRGGMSRSVITQKVADVLRIMQLADKRTRYPRQLSGGEKQRVALARSLVLEPDVLLLDEPLSALDPQLRRQVRRELKALQQRTGVTFLLVTHDQEEALSLSDRLAVMHQGALQQLGKPEELYHRPASRFVANFLGDMNWIGGVGVRPERLRIVAQAPSPSTRCSVAVVEQTIFFGNRIRLQVRLPDNSHCVVDTDQGVAGNETVYITWSPADEIRLP